MKLTVATLRSILNEIGDDVILADLDYGNGEFHPHTGIKRLLLLRDEETRREYLTVNRMGAHFTGKESQSHLKYAERYWDEDSVLKISSKVHVSGRSEQLKAFCQYCESRQIEPKRFKWDEIINDFESL